MKSELRSYVILLRPALWGFLLLAAAFCACSSDDPIRPEDKKNTSPPEDRLESIDVLPADSVEIVVGDSVLFRARGKSESDDALTPSPLTWYTCGDSVCELHNTTDSTATLIAVKTGRLYVVARADTVSDSTLVSTCISANYVVSLLSKRTGVSLEGRIWARRERLY